MTKQGAIDFYSKYAGEEMEFSDRDDFSGSHLNQLIGISYNTGLPYEDVADTWKYCRPIPKKETRLMTAQECVGKWLVKEGEARFVCGYCNDDLGTVSGWCNIEHFRDDGWLINTTPSLEGAKSLRVEVEA